MNRYFSPFEEIQDNVVIMKRTSLPPLCIIIQPPAITHDIHAITGHAFFLTNLLLHLSDIIPPMHIILVNVRFVLCRYFLTPGNEINKQIRTLCRSTLSVFPLLGNITRRANNSEIHLHTPTSRQCSKRCLLV